MVVHVKSILCTIMSFICEYLTKTFNFLSSRTWTLANFAKFIHLPVQVCQGRPGPNRAVWRPEIQIFWLKDGIRWINLNNQLTHALRVVDDLHEPWNQNGRDGTQATFCATGKPNLIKIKSNISEMLRFTCESFDGGTEGPWSWV